MDASQHKKQTVSGLSWNMLNQFLNQGISIFISILLMRILKPEDFGLIGMITVFTGFVAVFKRFGLGSSLIQKQDIDATDKDTIFWASIILGFTLTSTIVIAAPFIAEFYDEPKLTRITYAISITFFLNSTITVHEAILKKALSFKKLFIINTIAIICSAAIAIVFAYLNYGVWALVFQQLTTSLVSIILIWILASWNPGFSFSLSKLKIHLKFGLAVVGTQSLGYWQRNMDNLLIGRVLGADALGLYSRAYSFMMLPVRQVSSVISSVMFPSLSIIQNDKERIKTIYLKITRLIAFITFPMMGLLIVVAEPFVLVLLGKKWIDIVPLLKILAIVGGLQSVGTLVGNIFMSQGKIRKFFYVNLFSSLIVVTSFIIGVFISIEWVALCYLIAVSIIILPQWYYAGVLIDMGLFKMLENIYPHFLINSILISFGLILNAYNKGGGPFVELIFSSITYLVTYGILFRLFCPKLFIEVVQVSEMILRKNRR